MGNKNTERKNRQRIKKYGSLAAFEKQRRAKRLLNCPEKVRARDSLKKGVKYGYIEKLPCCICGDPKSEGHHTDYSKRRDVMWLCGEHHRAWHRVFVAE